MEKYLPTVKAWEARAAALGRPIGTVDDGPESSHLRLLLQRTIREGYESETQDGRPASSLMGKRLGFDQGRMYLSFSPFTQLVATNDFAVLFLFTPRSTMHTDVDLYWLVDGKASEVDVEAHDLGLGRDHQAGQGDHGEQSGGYFVEALSAGALFGARAPGRDVSAMVLGAVWVTACASEMFIEIEELAMPGLDLEGIGRSVVKLRAEVPDDAFTAGILGSQRIGNGVVISADGLILTIGYLVTEAADVWLTTADGRELAAHPLAYDQVTGFGLVLPLEKADIAPVPFGSSADLAVGDPAYVVSSPRVRRTAGGAYFCAARICRCLGISVGGCDLRHPGTSSLVRSRIDRYRRHFGGRWARCWCAKSPPARKSMPICSCPSICSNPFSRNLTTRGRASRQPRPWLGVYAVEMTGRVYVTGVAEGSPAHLADIREGDLISRVARHDIATLPDFYRRLWAVGPAGTGVPLTAIRGGTRLHLNVRSVDRGELLKRPQAH